MTESNFLMNPNKNKPSNNKSSQTIFFFGAWIHFLLLYFPTLFPVNFVQKTNKKEKYQFIFMNNLRYIIM